MNKIFKVVWSKTKECYVVVSEVAKNNGGKKKALSTVFAALVAAGAMMPGYVDAANNTSGGGVSTADASIAIGSGWGNSAYANNNFSIAIGDQTHANGKAAIALGRQAKTDGEEASIAIGNETEATAKDSTAVGSGSKSSGEYAAALGFQTKATANYATAIGSGARGYAEDSQAIGREAETSAGATRAIAIGTLSKSSGNYATSLGSSAEATAERAIAVGYKSKAEAERAISVGNLANATKNDSIAVGNNSAASGLNASAVGKNSKASGQSAAAFGDTAQATNTNATAVGNQANASNTNTTAIGNQTVASGGNATAVGYLSQATADGATAIGTNNKAGYEGTAVGLSNTVTGRTSAAFGRSNTVSGNESFAAGIRSTASGEHNVAIGYQAATDGKATVAIGEGSKADIADGVAIGSNSATTAAAGVQGFNPADSRTKTYGGLTGAAQTSTLGAVAVGNGDTATRQITGLAAGKENTDAVNVAQLRSVNLKYAGDTGNSDVLLDNGTLNIKGDNNSFMSTSADKNGITVTAKIGNPISANTAGKAVAPTTNGLATTTIVADAINASGWNVVSSNNGGSVTGTQATKLVNPGNTVTLSAGKNIVLDQNDKQFTYSLSSTLKDIESIQNGTSKITLNNGGGTTISGGNLSVDGNKITNVAKGTDDTDAVNYSQIKGLRTEVKAGTGITVTPSKGTDGHDIYTVSSTATGGAASTESVVKKAAATGDTNIADVSVAGGKAVNDPGAQYEVSVSKNAVKDAAREAVTVNNGGNTDNPITVTPTQDNTNHNTTYAVTFDGNKAAKQIPLTYKATNGTTTTADQTVKLDKGLNFTGGDYTTASVGADGKVTFDVNLGTAPTVTDGKPGVPGQAGAAGKDGIATVKTVVDTINNSGWKANAKANGGTLDGSSTATVVKPGDQVNFAAGKNLTVKQDLTGEHTYTYSLNKDLKDLTSVEIGGSTIKTDGDHITITSPDTTTGATPGATVTNKVANLGDEKHIKPDTYAVATDGSVTLKYVDGNSKDLTETTKITGITNQNLSNISTAGETKIKNLAKSAINMEDGKNTKASKRDVNGVDTYKVDVEGDLTGISSITNGGTNNGKISFGPNKTVTVDGDHSITLNASTGKIGGLQNLTFDPTNITSGQAATEDQLKSVHDTLKANERHIAPTTVATGSTETKGGTANAGGTANVYKYDAASKTVTLTYNDGNGNAVTDTKAVIDFSALNTGGTTASTWDIKSSADTANGGATATGHEVNAKTIANTNSVEMIAGKNLTVKQTSDTNGAKVEFALSDEIAVGKDGTNGVDGKIGVNGKDGASVVINGKDGSIGLTGAPGTPGTPGASATLKVKDGVPGVDGAPGTNLTRIVYTDKNNVEHEVATHDDGMKFAGDDGQANQATNANVIKKHLNNVVDIIGGATKSDLTTNNIGVNNDGNGKLLVQLSKNLKGINTIKNGNTTITLNDTPSTTTPAVTITGGNLSLGDGTTNNKIVNVAPGTDDTDAVNVKQLKDAKTVLADGKNTKKSGTGTAADPYKVNVEGDLTEITSITNKADASGNAGKITFSPNQTVTVSGDHNISLNGKTGDITGLTNTTIPTTAGSDFATKGRAATEEQLKIVNDKFNNKINLGADGSTETTKLALDNNGGIKFNIKGDGSGASGANQYISTTASGSDIKVDLTQAAKDKLNKTYDVTSTDSSVQVKSTTTNGVTTFDLKVAPVAGTTSTWDIKSSADTANGGATATGHEVNAKTIANTNSVEMIAGKNLTVKQTSDTNGAKVEFALSDEIAVGKDGTNGVDGKIGVNGKDGASVVINGKDGSIGLTGAPGTPGTPGASATLKVKDGVPGVDGAPGTNLTRIVYTDKNNVEHEVATHDDGMKFAGDDGQANQATNANVIKKHLNNVVDIIGGATKSDLTTNNIGVNNDGNGKLLVQLSKNLNGINTVKNGNTTITLNDAPGGATNTPAVTISGGNLSMGDGTHNNKIVNVAPGTDDSDAVNYKQLKAAKTEVKAGKNVVVTSETSTTDGHTTYTVNASTPAVYTKPDGTKLVKQPDGTFKEENGTVYNGPVIASFEDGTGATTGGNMIVNNVGSAINNHATPGVTSPTYLDKLDAAAGDNNTKNAAVNVTDLKNTKDGLIDKGLKFDANVGGVKTNKLGSTVKVQGAGTSADADYSGTNIKTFISQTGDDTTIDVKLDKNLKGINKISNGGSSITLNDTPSATVPAVTITGGNLSMGDGTTNNKIVNLAPGTADTDAVNVKQLKDTELHITPGTYTPDTNKKVKLTYTDGNGALVSGKEAVIDLSGLSTGGATASTWNVKSSANTTDGGAVGATHDANAQNIANGKTVEFQSGKNLVVNQTNDTTNGNATVEFSLSDNITVGKDGANGKDGSVGAKGADGSAVVMNGKDGSIGLNGTNGANGISIKGKDGANGVGIDGKDGVTRIVYTEKVPDPANPGTTKEVTHEVATMDDGLKFTGNNTGTVNKHKLGSLVKVQGEGISATDEAAFVSASGNIAVTAENNDTLTIRLNKNLKGLNSIQLGGNTIQSNGDNITFTTNGGTTKTVATTDQLWTIQANGTDVPAKSGKVNLVAGDHITITPDAANGKMTISATGFGSMDGFNVKTSAESATVGTHAGDTTENIKNGKTVDMQAGKNLIVTQTNDGNGNTTVNYALNKDVDLGTNGSLKAGDTTVNKDGVTIANGPSITKTGVDAGDKKITNVADGAVNATSKDAVNGSQLKKYTDAAKTTVEAGDNNVKVETDNSAADGHTNYKVSLEPVVTIGDTHKVKIDGHTGDITGLTNVDLTDPTFATKGRAATEEQLNKVLTEAKKKAVEKVQAGTAAAGDTNIATVAPKAGDTFGAAGATYEVSVSKNAVKDAAKEAVKVTSASPAITVTADTSVAHETTYKVGFDGNQAATQIPLTYKQNGGNTRTVKLSDGLNFIDGTNTKARTAADGKVTFDVMGDLTGITSISNAAGGPKMTFGGSSINVTNGDLNMGGNKITKLATGTAKDDAATVGQLTKVTSNNHSVVINKTTDADGAPVYDLAVTGTPGAPAADPRVDMLGEEIGRVGAQGAALSALKPIQYDPLEPTQIMAGYGNYRGNSAIAMGVAHYKNESTMMHAGLAWAGGSRHMMANAGVTWKVGNRDSEAAVADRYRKGPISSAYAMQQEMAAMKAQNAGLKGEVSDLKAENEQMKAQIAAMMAKLGL